jgi:transcription initiation factor TFIIIB Brf1 subunit/transcription initiation factor TFIIB
MDFDYDTIFNLKKNNKEPDEFKCIACGNYDLFNDTVNGGIVCTQCGVVNTMVIIDDTAEWNFGGEDSMYQKDPSRCGAPTSTLLEKSSMSTMINVRNAKGISKNLKKIQQQQSMSYVERSLYHVFENIQRMASDNGKLPQNIIEDAKFYYKAMSEKRLSRGSIRKGIIACCIYFACKINKVPRSVKEISKMTNIDVAIINKTVKIFQDVLKNELPKTSSTSVDDLIIRFSNVFNFPRNEQQAVIKRVRVIYKKVIEDDILPGKTPTSIASGIIYFVLSNKNYNVDKKIIVEKHGISIVTLNKMMTTLTENTSKFDLI